MIDYLIPQPPKNNKPFRLGKRPVILSLVVMLLLLGYMLLSAKLLSSYAYASSEDNCSYTYFNETVSSAYALSLQFFHPLGNITQQIAKECNTLQKSNTEIQLPLNMS